jgi:hypothetical protein
MGEHALDLHALHASVSCTPSLMQSIFTCTRGSWRTVSPHSTYIYIAGPAAVRMQMQPCAAEKCHRAHKAHAQATAPHSDTSCKNGWGTNRHSRASVGTRCLCTATSLKCIRLRAAGKHTMGGGSTGRDEWETVEEARVCRQAAQVPGGQPGWERAAVLGGQTHEAGFGGTCGVMGWGGPALGWQCPRPPGSACPPGM